jgi:iron complex outermembrane receptor protein
LLSGVRPGGRGSCVSRGTNGEWEGFAVRRVRLAAILACWALSLSAVALARADEAINSGQPLQTVVVQATAIAGATIDIDKVPGNVQVLSAADLARAGSASLTRALNSQLSSVNVNDDADDPFQPDILYRGFEASPVLGTPQGLAVYQNGVRINEAFGDTVNWDLFPDIAINQVELVSSSPVYGLNALGGAVSVTMKNGFTYQGNEVEISGGSYGLHSALGQFGVNAGPFGFYIAGKALDWTGWRDYSRDRVRQVYAALSLHFDRASFDLSYARADNTLDGQGPAPLQELAVNRSLVFTGPQNNIDTLDFLTLDGSFKLTDSWSLQGVAYYRQYGQSVSNGNTTDYTACTNTPGFLCQPDGLTPLMNAAGQGLPDISQGGTVTIGENDFELIHTYGSGAALQTTESQSILGHGNQFTAGATVDYAAADFFTGAQIGVIDPQLFVLSSNLIVDTPQSSPAALEFSDQVPVSVRSINRDYGFYATDTFDVTPAFSMTASGRYNVAYIDLQDQLGTNLTGDNRYSHFNPAVGATYKILPALTAYAGISANNRTPTASEIECSNPLQPCLLPTNLSGDPPTLRQVVAHTTELGLRGRNADLLVAGGEVSWNLSVFRTLLHDDIYGIATSVSQGFFQNIGDTRRQGVEGGIELKTSQWSGFANYSYVDATFRSGLLVPSPSNAFQDADGNIQVEPGDHLPGIPEQRLKIGADYRPLPNWTLGATFNLLTDRYYVGDESNQLAPIPGYHTVNFHTSYTIARQVELFAALNNLFNGKYATWGILSDPTGINAPGIPPNGVTNGPGVDNRFLSPAAPLEVFGGVRITF